MNLITDVWLPVELRSGKKEKRSIVGLFDGDDPVVDIHGPTEQLTSAVNGLLIGLLNAITLPKDDEEWADAFEDGASSVKFRERIMKYVDCFNLDNTTGARTFMQDINVPDNATFRGMSAITSSVIATKTIKENGDIFAKHYDVQSVGLYWASIILYAYQTQAYGGGGGHRDAPYGKCVASHTLTLKGGTLWESLWLNVLSGEHVRMLSGDPKLTTPVDIFPWMSDCVDSHDETTIFAEQVNPMSVHFLMCRRVKLGEITEGVCDLTGESGPVVSKQARISHGNKYGGVWRHPNMSAGRVSTKTGKLENLQTNGVTGDIPKFGIFPTYIRQLDVDGKFSPPIVSKVLFNSGDRRDAIGDRCVDLVVAGLGGMKAKVTEWFSMTVPHIIPRGDKELLTQSLLWLCNHLTSNILAPLVGVKDKLGHTMVAEQFKMRVAHRVVDKCESRFMELVDELSGCHDVVTINKIKREWVDYCKLVMSNEIRESFTMYYDPNEPRSVMQYNMYNEIPKDSVSNAFTEPKKSTKKTK